MTTINNVEILDLTTTESMPVEESLWSRIVCQIGILFGRGWDYMNEDMGPVDASDHYFPTDACCF